MSTIWKTPQGFYDAWVKLNKAMKSADKETLELLSHPEATDEQILALVKLRAQTARQHQATTYNLVQLLQQKNRDYLLDSVYRILGTTNIPKPPDLDKDAGAGDGQTPTRKSSSPSL